MSLPISFDFENEDNANPVVKNNVMTYFMTNFF